MASNETVQKITIQVDESIAALNSLNANLKSTLQDSNKNLTDSSKTFQQNETQIKKWSESATDGLKKYGSAALDNIKLGAQALTLDLGRTAIQQAASDAVKTAFSFSKAFAEIKSRSNASAQDLESWRKSIRQISVDTTANMDSMAESFKDMFSSVKDPKELLAIMDSVGKAAAMGDGDSTKVSNQIKGSLQDQGKEITKANVDEYLGASDVLRRKGKDFGDLNAASGAVSGINGADIANSGMSMRQVANILAASTQATGNRQGSEAVKALLGGESDFKSAVGLSSGLGLKMKDDKIDLSSLGSKDYSQKVMSMGSTDQIRRLVLKDITGASDQAVQAFLNIAKNGESFRNSLNEAATDTKTFSQSALEGKDNLQNAYQGFDNELVSGVSDILGKFEDPIKNLLGGHIGAAAGGVPGAIKGGLDGAADHPALVAGAIATTIGGGMLLKGIFGKIPGLGLAKGMAEGQVAKKMGAEPVFVVNASEIGDATAGPVGSAIGAGMSPFGAVLRALGMSFVGIAGAAAGGAALGYVGGKMINNSLDKHASENSYGQKYNAVEKGFAKIVPEFLGGVSKEEYQKSFMPKVILEVHAVDTTLKITPKAGHLQKDAGSK